MSQLLNFSDVAKAFGAQDVLENIQWQVNDRIRAALVGRNGAGKTTLFRLITGELEPDRGSVNLRPGAVVSTMEQELDVETGRTLREVASQGLHHLHEMQEEFESVTQGLSNLSEGDPKTQELLDRYAYLEERLRQEGAYSAEARVKSVLDGLHFTEEDLDRPMSEFSGGQKSRASLARVLLRDPDLLLLDEPTNHLDLDAIEWLESFLESYRGAYLLVSHDRVFLNKLAREVVELRGGRLHHYQGNYDNFLDERERRLEDHVQRYEAQREEIRRTETFIQKNIARASTTKRAQSRRNKLERMELIPPPEWPASSIKMRLPQPDRSAKIVAEAKGLGKRYGDTWVFRNLTFQIQRGEKVGLVGPNGVGKTTLLRLLIGEQSESEGTLRIGPSVQMGYYEQEQLDLRGSQSVLDEVWQVTPHATEGELRNVLGSFLFRGEDVFKSLNQLSGGERSRVALAKMVRGGANFLMMDEPTNHLDLESRSVMERALDAYQGTLLVASHDRALLEHVTDRVLEVHLDGARWWESGYPAYAAERQSRAVGRSVRMPGERAPQSSAPARAAKTGDAKGVKGAKGRGSGGAGGDGAPVLDKAARKQLHAASKERKREEQRLSKRVAQAERAVIDLEAKKESLELAMADPAIATDSSRLAELARELKASGEELARGITEWERLASRLEAFRDGDA